MAIGRKPRILFVDDNPDERDLDRAALRVSGIDAELTILESGEDALDYINHRGKHAGRNQYEVPDVVFLDVEMGKVSGFDVLHEIRQDVFWHLVPVVMFSSSSEEGDIRLAYEKGANSYLVKATNMQEAKERAKNILTYWLKENQVVADAVRPV